MKILSRHGEELNDIEFLDVFTVDEETETLRSLINTAYTSADDPTTLVLLEDFFELQEDPDSPGDYILVCK